jgi:cytochrome c oxidase accessory protein FixG
MTQNALSPGENVLSTLREDGSRIWMRPRLSEGRFLNARRVVAYGLIAAFLVLPFVRVNGHPAMLLDVAARRFHLFGFTFHPTDSALLMLLMLSIFLGIFWITALFGRVWCGWGCPQTVYMEFIFRPIERLIEGGAGKQRQLDKKGRFAPKRLLKYAVFLVLSFVLGNQFLAYFVGWERLATWMTGSPLDHWGGFAVMAVTTGLVFFDFAYFREQMCTVVCPYARLQSALIDRHSMIVGYDALRGEPRRRVKSRVEGEPAGDCIDCNACVATCPTGIDIRQGLQLECVACTQCIDACDNVMDKIGKPRGLIRLSSQNALTKREPNQILRFRTMAYPVLIVGLLSILVFAFEGKGSADVTVLRQLNAPYVLLDDGAVRNQLRVKVVNRSGTEQVYDLTIPGVGASEILAPQFPLRVADGDSITTPLFITLPRGRFEQGKLDIDVQVQDEAGFSTSVPFLLLGPEETT